jgi:phosphate transport system ATP-binding protein
MEQLVRNEPPESESSGFLPASDIDTGVIPMRPSGRGMLQVAVDETRRSAALKAPVKARVEELDFYYGQLKALKNLNMHIREKQVTALIGPSGCGKTTFLRCFNRMHDLTPGSRYEGRIMLVPEEINLVARNIDPIEVRMRIGMVFQKPNPFPKSIFENVAYGLRIRGVRSQIRIQEEVEKALREAALWDEVKDRLTNSALSLSGGQQQRLCIARALATSPEMLLFDEPTSALDPIATARIEELIASLREQVTVLIVTHNMQQAARVSDYTAFMYLGELIEFDETSPVATADPSARSGQPQRQGCRARESFCPEQFIECGLGARLRIHPLDDHRAVETVRAVLRRHAAGDHHRAGRHVPLQYFTAGTVVDAGAGADEYSHRDNRAGADHDALDDLGARADEAVILDDGGRSLQRFEHPADADAAGQVYVAPDLRTRTDRGPGVDHGAGAHVGADVDVAGHQDRIGCHVGAVAYQRVRHHAYALLRELSGVGGSELQRHPIVEARVTGVDHDVVVDAKIEQHRLLQPGVHLPAAIDVLGHPALTPIQCTDRELDRRARIRIDARTG